MTDNTPSSTPRRIVEAPLPGGGFLALELASPTLVRLRVSPGSHLRDVHSYAVVRESWPRFEAEAERDRDVYTIRTSHLTIKLVLDPFSLTIDDRSGTTRFETPAGAIEVKARELTLRRKLPVGECIYGLGEFGESFNRVPGKYRFWNRDFPQYHPHKDFYCTIPFGICAPGGAIGPHGMLLDNPGDVTFDVGRTESDVLSVRTRTGEIDLWLFFEDSPSDILFEYTALTGRMKRPPMWAIGFHQCRWSYPTGARVREVAAEFRRRRIPCDAIYLDLHYMKDYLVFTWDDDAFPAHRRFLADLSADGFSTVCIVDPGVGIKHGYFAHEQGAETDGFFLRALDGELIVERVWPGEVHHPDFTHPNTRRLWGEWQRDKLLEPGVAGIWNDMNEPAIFQGEGATRDYRSDAAHFDEGDFRTHGEIHNVYGHTMAQASQEGQLAHQPDQRPFTITRSGYSGVQRYSCVWTGDNRSVWAAMPLDIVLNLSMGMAGIAFIGCDIGGFGGETTPELYTRWMEWGVFQPFCRVHSAIDTGYQEPWALGPGSENIARRMIELRYRLLPYIYTQFVDASETGAPVNRPLALEFPNDATVASIGDQFMLGPDLLIAPVLQPGVSARGLYLPAGEWVHFWSGHRFEGGRWIVIDAPLGQPPLFVRAGAVIPSHPVRQHTKEPEPDEMFLDVYPAAALSGRLVEDDGATLAYERGAESRVLFSGAENAKNLSLLIGAPQGPHRSARKKWTVRIHRSGRAVETVSCNGERMPFEQRAAMTAFSISAKHDAIEVTVSYAG